MALLMFDGFEFYGSTFGTGMMGPWKNLARTVGNGGRTGAGYMEMYPSGGTSVTQDFADPSTVFIGFGVRRTDSGSTSWELLRVMGSGGEVLCTLYDGAPGGLVAVHKGDGSLVGTITSLTVNDQWRYLELKVVVSATVGRLEIHINGVEEFNSGDIDLVPGTSVGVRDLRFGQNSTGANTDTRYDDLYVCDDAGTANNTFLGPVRISALVPASDVETDWTPNSGTVHYTQVDDLVAEHDSDTTYVASNVVGARDVYGLPDLAPAYQNPIAVQAFMVARHDDSSGGVSIAPLFKSGVSEAEGATLVMTSDYAYSTDPLREVSPVTGTPWTLEQINALELGVVVKANL